MDEDSDSELSESSNFTTDHSSSILSDTIYQNKLYEKNRKSLRNPMYTS